MKKLISKFLSIIGTILIFIPIIFPIILSIIFFLKEKIFRFDYLMPMELFFLVLMGGIILIIVHIIEKISLKKFLLIFILFIASFILPQIFAILTGVASGEKELTPIIFSILIIFIAIYSILEIILGISGIKLIKKI